MSVPAHEVSASSIKTSVLQLYMSHPLPQWSKEERYGRLPFEICRYQFLGLADFMPNARFLDVGCGTGMRSMLVAQHFGVKEFVGLDHSSASLDIARRVAQEDGFQRFTPVQGDLFNIPYPDASFDIVVSWGVLHHTHDPYRGLREMMRVCRPNGFVALYLYNKWNHWRHNIQKNRVSRIAGPNFEKRFEVAHRMYGTKPVDQMSPADIVLFYDKYCHPHKSDHTFGETLSWFDELGLTFWGSFPPLRFRDAIRYIQYRGEISDRYPLRAASNRRIVAVARKLPRMGRMSPPFKRSSFLHNFLWQAALVWAGRHGEYSDGSALCARKPTSGSPN